MTTLVIALHHGPPAVAALCAALAGRDVDVHPLLVPGLSSAYRARAAQLRHDGRILPALCRLVGAREPEAYERIVLVSWSAGYALVDEILACPNDAALVAAWVALDSGYGDPRPSVRAYADRARRGEAVCLASYTDVPTYGYASSGDYLRALGQPGGRFAVEHLAAGPGAHSAAFWRAEHTRALERGPARVVEALELLEQPAPSPAAQVAPASLGLRALTLAREALAAGVREVPPGSNRGPEVDAYLDGCVRNGRRLGVLGVPWCAAFASWCVWVAEYGERAARCAVRWTSRVARALAAEAEPQVGWRAAVSELVADARATGTWHEAGDGEPEAGDLLVCARDGGDPRVGGSGHVAIVESWGERRGVISGNDDGAVRRREWAAGEAPPWVVVGWVRIG